ncbi:MAG: bifunctional folylpolyglutamate synthase/dihydrofolate synthase [Microthrixaceae bacterium]|nr:bifunctional folylpolyglutamate synthase/dihydrofolate synthase [Microthrixaceae bacterium]
MAASGELPEVLARLDRHTNFETLANSGVAAGRVAGLSLDPMRRLCTLLGDPQDSVPAIHITGTNGKGSVAAMVSALVAAGGLTPGTYTSPHLERINERIRRNGEEIAEADLAEVLGGVLDVVELMDAPATWFEVVTAAAFRWFSEAAIDVSVVEVGLLGRYDATNVLDADVSVITNIGPDHTDGAPGWELAVASEKAGIVTPGRDVVVGALMPELYSVVEAEGPSRILALGRDLQVLDTEVAVGGRTVSVDTPWGRHDNLYIPLHGRHQAGNAALAIGATEAFLDRELSPEVIESGLSQVSLPGRCEVVGHDPLVVLDGAHNRDAATALATTLVEEFTTLGSRLLVVGMLAGRDPRDVLGPLAEVGFDVVIVTAPPSPRSLDPSVLVAAASDLGLATQVVADPWAAVERALAHAAEEDLVVVAGSFYLVGPARSAITSVHRSTN